MSERGKRKGIEEYNKRNGIEKKEDLKIADIKKLLGVMDQIVDKKSEEFLNEFKLGLESKKIDPITSIANAMRFIEKGKNDLNSKALSEKDQAKLELNIKVMEKFLEKAPSVIEEFSSHSHSTEMNDVFAGIQDNISLVGLDNNDAAIIGG